MEITFVSAFLCGARPKRGYDEYKAYFDRLASTGLPFVVFLDRRLAWTFPSNVRVYPASLEDTWVGQTVSANSVLPAERSPADTLEYMKIQCTKFEWVRRATELNPWGTHAFAWIDFGLVHVFRTPEATLARLRTLRLPSPGLRTAGIWSQPTSDVWSRVCWRFAGGFFVGDAESLRRMDAVFRKTLATLQPRFTWEVNVWAWMESQGIEFGWYPCDHDDTILAVPGGYTNSE